MVTRLVKNGVMTEKEEDILGTGDMTPCIEVIGDFEALDLNDMDVWGGHLKFSIRDMEAKDEEEIQARGWIAMQSPELATLFTAKAAMLVYKQVTIITRTTTIVEQMVDGIVQDRQQDVQERESEEWQDITREFGKRSQNHFGWS